MKKSFFGALLILFLAGCSEKESYFENATCITNVHIIDAAQGLQPNMTVIFKGDLISKVVPSDSITLSRKNNIIDGTGKYLIPGLWDAHVHFAYDEALAPSMFDLFLRYGITSVRDTGGRLDAVLQWKSKAEKNPSKAPRVMIAGPLIDGTPTVYDGSSPRRPDLGKGAATVPEVKEIAYTLHDEGVDFLKAYEMLSVEQFEAVMQVAKENNLKVAGHIPLSMDAISASNAGLNSIEHMRNLELSCAANAETLLEERRKMLIAGMNEAGMELRSKIHKAQKAEAIRNQSEEKTTQVLDVLKKNGTWQVPTMVLNSVLTSKHVTTSSWRETFMLLPDSIAAKWLAGSKRIEAMTVNEDFQAQSDWDQKIVARMHKKGIGILAGTDTPIAYLTPGYSLHEELKMLVEVGLTPLEALETATLNPARFFEMQDSLGLIKEDYYADLLLINGNPLENIENTKNIHKVIKSGEIYNRTQED